MPDYIFKTYLADGREHFLYGEIGDRRAQLTKKGFPFPESLLRLLYLDIWAYDGQIKQFDKLLMELYRTREEKCARQLLPLLDELAECVAGSESPETELLRKELTASLNRFLRKLPEKDRTVFLLRYYYAGTKEDIARKTGLSSNQVKYILQKVRKQLADTLKKEGLQ